MKLNLLVLSILTFVFFIRCEKEGLSRTERLIVGSWKYDRVTENGKKITEEFDQFSLTFNENFTASYEDTEEGLSYTGIWDLVEGYNGESYTGSIFVSLEEESTGELTQLVLDNAGVSKKRINASFRDDNDRFVYRLIRD